MGTNRYVYNNGLNGVKNNNENVNFYSLRDKYVTSDSNPKPLEYLYDLFYSNKFEYIPKDWELETPKDIRAGALRDLCKAYKTCMSNLKNGNISKFNLNFRSKKKSSSLEIPKSAIKIKDGKLVLYKRYMNSDIKFSNDKCLKNLNIEYDTRLKYEKNKWYLIVPIKHDIKYKCPKYNECGIDPGSRKFNTVYSDEMVLKIEMRKENLRKLHNKLDHLNSLRSKKIIKLSRYKRVINKTYTSLDNCIDDMHNKTINVLTSCFSRIYIPKFETQEIVNINRNRKTRRNLYQQKHYKYRQKLIDKTEMYKDVEVIVCTEEFTTKTCTKCGVLNNPGSSEVYICNSCNLKIDRDINGARNVLLKETSK